MTHPTDEELEAMAKYHEWLRGDSQTATMLLACKGRVNRLPRTDGEGGWTLPVELLAEIRDEVYASEWDAPCAEIIEIIALSAEARILSALEPAPDHAEWEAAIDAAAQICEAEAKYRLKQIEDTATTDRDQILRWTAGKVQTEVLAKKIRALKKGPDQ